MQTESPISPTSGESRRRLISADRVQGTPVYDAQGDKLGHVEDVMLDKESGKVAYAILSYGGFLGAGERFHPVPWGMLRYDTGRNGYVTPIDKSQFETGPTLDRSQVGADDDGQWSQAVHSHYGLPAPFI